MIITSSIHLLPIIPASQFSTAKRSSSPGFRPQADGCAPCRVPPSIAWRAPLDSDRASDPTSPRLRTAEASSLHHVPLHIIGEHAEEDVRPDARFQPMTDRPHVQIDTFQRAEGALHLGQPLVVEHGLLSRHVAARHAGADHVEAIERCLGRDASLIDAERERAGLDVELEVLGDLVLPDHLANAHADRGGAFEPATRHHGLDLVQLARRGGDQVLALLGTKLGERGIAAGHQPLAWIVVVRQAQQIALVEQIELQVTGVREPGDRAALQRRDPVDAVQLAHGIDLHAGDHTAVAHHHQPVDAELVARLLDLREHRFRIARVAVEHGHRHGATAFIRKKTIVDLQRAGPAITAVAELGERACRALEPARRQIEQHQPASLQVPLGEALLDRTLALDQPVHRLVQIVLVRVRHTQIVGQCGIGPGLQHPELAGFRRDDPPGDHGDDEIALDRRLRVDQLVEPKSPIAVRTASTWP